MTKTDSINIIKHLLSEVEKESNEVTDLSYRLDVGTRTESHPINPWIEKNFYNGNRTITITVEYNDAELEKKSRKEIIKFFNQHR